MLLRLNLGCDDLTMSVKNNILCDVGAVSFACRWDVNRSCVIEPTGEMNYTPGLGTHGAALTGGDATSHRM